MDARGKELEQILSSMEQEFGKGIIVPLKPSYKAADIPVISTGNTPLDQIINGGYPKGSVVEIYGENSTGKTTLCLQSIIEVQKLGGLAAFVDAEHTLHLPYASDLGVQTEDLTFVRPEYGEQALTIVDKLIRSGIFSIIIVDSVAALVPKLELSGEVGEQDISLQAALMATALRRLMPAIRKTNTVLIFTNQVRANIASIWRDADKTPGGKALRFYTTIRIELQEQTKDVREAFILEDGTTDIKALVVKSKVSKPYQQVQLKLKYGIGFLQ